MSQDQKDIDQFELGNSLFKCQVSDTDKNGISVLK